MPNAARPPRGQRVAPRPPDSSSAGFRVFIDFDNTITQGDVLDGIIETFSVSEEWRTLEAAWAAGQITTRTCLEGQMRGLRATWPELARHLNQVRIDPGFARLRDLLRREAVDLTIVSDNFDLVLDHILKQEGLTDVACLANHLELAAGRRVPSFPFGNPDCPGCAHCKKIHFMPPHRDARLVVYIGDGRSDICPATHADIVFAKTSLLSYLQRAAIPCTAYGNLSEVAAALEKTLHENKI